MTDAEVAGARSFLPYKSVDIYFIYSFVLEHLGSAKHIAARLHKLGWLGGPPLDRQGRPPFLHIQARVGGEFRARTRYRELIPATRTRLDYKEWDREAKGLTRKQAAEHKPNPLAHPQDPRTDSFEVEVESVARLFDNGAGCITFRIGLDQEISFRRVYEVLSLSQRLYNGTESHAGVPVGGRKGNLFVHFRALVCDLVGAINGVQAKKSAAVSERSKLVQLQDQEIIDLSVGRRSPAQDEECIDGQNPYVLTVVELDAKDPRANFFDKPATDTMRLKELTAILCRLVYPISFFRDLRRTFEFVRIPPDLLVDGLYLRNYSWDSRSLMCFSETSSLFACLNKLAIPAVLIRNSLLDTLEIVRTRWHMSILLNGQLDNDLDAFRSGTSETYLNLLARLFERRKRFAAFLHDPLPYSFEGGS
ncbi:MAG: hypothetical protein L0191_03810, partial [Acidobacteria bacterium]|nr:hypothetical protein [Acidobacteriota bacterium]